MPQPSHSAPAPLDLRVEERAYIRRLHHAGGEGTVDMPGMTGLDRGEHTGSPLRGTSVIQKAEGLKNPRAKRTAEGRNGRGFAGGFLDKLGMTGCVRGEHAGSPLRMDLPSFRRPQGEESLCEAQRRRRNDQQLPQAAEALVEDKVGA